MVVGGQFIISLHRRLYGILMFLHLKKIYRNIPAFIFTKKLQYKYLKHLLPMHPFSTLENIRTPFGFLMFSGDRERAHQEQMNQQGLQYASGRHQTCQLKIFKTCKFWIFFKKPVDFSPDREILKPYKSYPPAISLLVQSVFWNQCSGTCAFAHL